ncbi:MAG TPA: carboxypeptidase-like regulatory domain-containing protein [Candidatus Nanoarchaeia archaeon]|nr:carboxypeptidase-like regulatory domain-containing protein [Candidatus Nanoarchaeia archaeon]
MRNTNKWILSLAGVTLLGAAALMHTREESPPYINQPSSDPQRTQQITTEAQQEEENGTTRIRVSEEPKAQEDLREKYERFILNGQVIQEQKPLSNVDIEARVASIVGNTQKAWRTETDQQGRFSIRVPALTSYDIEARFTTPYGKEKRREVTHAPSDNILIAFNDSPDVRLKVNDNIRRAVLQTTGQKTLEGLVQGNEAVFEDVPEGTIYNAFIATINRAVIQDQIPVFDKDVERTYSAPQAVFGQIQARDTGEKSGIAGAVVTLTLPNIDQKIFAEKVTTDQNGIWQGWLTPTKYSIEANAEGYIRKEINSAELDAEEKLIIWLKQGAALRGKVIDQESKHIAGAEVYLLEPLGLSPFGGLAPGMTNNKGEFEIKGIDPNRPPLWEPGLQFYVPVAVKKGYMQPVLEAIVLENIGEENTQNKITLRIVKTIDKIEGRVVDRNNNPARSLLEISLMNLLGSNNVSNAPFWQRYSIETTPDGSFIVPDIAPGRYMITAFPGRDAERSMQTRQEINVPTDNPVQIMLEEGISLEGRVLQYNGEAAKDVNLRLTKRDSTWETYTRTDDRGNFAVVAPNGPVNYFAWWKNESREGVLEEQRGYLDASAGQQRIMLRESKYLTVQVADAASRQPVPVYSATFIETEGPKRVTIRNGFDQQGILYFPLQDPFFPLRVVVQAPGYTPSDRREITKGRDQTISIEMKKKE